MSCRSTFCPYTYCALDVMLRSQQLGALHISYTTLLICTSVVPTLSFLRPPCSCYRTYNGKNLECGFVSNYRMIIKHFVKILSISRKGRNLVVTQNFYIFLRKKSAIKSSAGLSAEEFILLIGNASTRFY
jgi:hypothetical protein